MEHLHGTMWIEYVLIFWHTNNQAIHKCRCDRILWYGRGLTQLSYVRGESRFSDHRPVCGVFLAEVESINRSRIKKSMSCSNSRIEVEELLPHLHGYTEFNFFWGWIYKSPALLVCLSKQVNCTVPGNLQQSDGV